MSFVSSVVYSGGFIENQLPFNLKDYGFDTSAFPLCNIEWLVSALLFYIFILVAFQVPKINKEEKSTQSYIKNQIGLTAKYLISLHNLLLCSFSIICFIKICPILYHFYQIGLVSATCNGHIMDEYDNQWGYWMFLFYISKYYEFVDTWIVIWKGRRPILLQKFHHIGACVGLWIILCGRCTAGVGFLLPNSFVHAIMYGYYAMSVWKIRCPVKS